MNDQGRWESDCALQDPVQPGDERGADVYVRPGRAGHPHYRHRQAPRQTASGIVTGILYSIEKNETVFKEEEGKLE